jgi:hypothetical protein
VNGMMREKSHLRTIERSRTSPRIPVQISLTLRFSLLSTSSAAQNNSPARIALSASDASSIWSVVLTLRSRLT